jgi:hypothetical protein
MNLPWWVPVLAALVTSLPAWATLFQSLSSRPKAKKSASGKSGTGAKPGKAGWRFWLPVVLPVLALMMVGWDFYSRYNPPEPFKIDRWGTFANNSKPTFYAEFNSRPIASLADGKKLYLVARTNFADVDEWTDRNIELSKPYTVTGDNMSVAVVTTGKIKVLAPPNVTNFDQYLILLPNDVDPRSVVNLASVLQLKGTVIGKGGESVMAQPAAGNP